VLCKPPILLATAASREIKERLGQIAVQNQIVSCRCPQNVGKACASPSKISDNRDRTSVLRYLPSTISGPKISRERVHPRATMELLGHSSITVTMNVYGHVMPAMMRDAANAMDSVLAAGKWRKRDFLDLLAVKRAQTNEKPW